jgi:hypothetical protein
MFGLPRVHGAEIDPGRIDLDPRIEVLRIDLEVRD